MKQNGTVTITIDNNQYVVDKGVSILEAARKHEVYIPTLCFHPELSAHGGCRMCIVEVEGLRNLPTACTTPVTDGMNIRTATQQVQESRREILQLFMSEHPSSCLICDESKECSQVLNTIRKSGVTTGCRYCPKDQQCELQEVAAYLGVDYLEYPIYYRNFRVEREDPFYDRDYNLCILCGRCVRVCQEIRLANVLAFKDRGRNSVVGPAFNRTHFESGCEFCGACVGACPVGALREKTRAWEGKPERETITTCSFCGVGCQVRLLTRDDRVIGSLPAEDPVVNKGQLCVKGRFCVTEFATGHQRLRQPYRVHESNIRAEIPWSEAAELAATKLKTCAPEDFAMLVSPNCTNEDLYAAQKFVRATMKSHRIDTSARTYYGPAFNAYLDVLAMSVPLTDVAKADTVLCVGLDPKFGRSVVGVEIRRAIKRGAKIVTINPRQHALTLNAHLWIHPVPGKESDTIAALAALTSKSPADRKGANATEELHAVADMLLHGENTVIIMGSEFLQLDEPE
jgi:formate dehydrogenase alpha subunit